MPVAQDTVFASKIMPVFKTVEQRSLAFFRDELGLVPQSLRRHLHRDGHVQLREITAIVGVGSSEGVYIAFSYDEVLARAITKRYTAELSISPNEEDLYMHETASDVVNVIVGNCTTELAGRSETVTLSPPVLALGARTIQGMPQTAIAALELRFAEGTLDIAFVGPKLMFDEKLNYTGEYA